MTIPNEDNNNLKIQAWLISIIGACVLISLVTFGMQAISRFKEVNSRWEKHSLRATTISNTIAELNENIGYGGFIHDFKNLILRRDLARYQPTIEKNITDVTEALDTLDDLLKQPEDQEAVTQLRATISEYRSKYYQVVQMINTNISSIEIDAAVKISDTAALDARAKLVARASQRIIETQEHAQTTEREAIRFMQYGGAILLVAIIASIATLIFFLRRVYSTNTLIQQTRTHLNNLLDTSPDPMISVSQDGLIIRANIMAEALFGYTQKDLLSMNIEELIPERFRQKHVQLRKGFISHPHNRMMGEGGNTLVALNRDGREISVDISLSHSGEGKDRLASVTLRDMTETIRMGKETRQMREQLSQASKMESIGHITGGIAHDFNNMLGAIMGYAELSQSKLAAGDSIPVFKYQDAILKSGNRAKELIRQMLTFSRITPNESKCKTTALLVISIVEETVVLLRASLPSGISINYKAIDKGLKVRILPVHLHQILLNLIVNAQDSIGKYGEIGISLSKQHHEKTLCSSCKTVISGDFVQIKVTDNGEGIPEHILNEIFDPFFTSKGVGKGTGMGLSVIHGLVHAQEGHITVDTIPGELTSFNILLPLDLSENITIEKNIPIDIEKEVKGSRVMVVDDEVELCEMLNEYLMSSDIESIYFTDPIKALEIFTQNSDQFDLVITDETMPGMSGMELSKKMLILKPELPIILCTGYSDEASSESAEKIGISRFLSKPVNLSELMLIIQKTIHSKN